jgi:hypothetical protein
VSLGSSGNYTFTMGTPSTVYEGVTASNGFVNFFNPVHVPGQNLFHFEGEK